MRVATRQQSGMVEDLLRSQVADRTNWRALLKGDAEPIDTVEMRERIFDACADGVRDLQLRYGLQAIQPVADAEVVEIRYPVEAYPTKVVSTDLDKTRWSRARSRASGSIPDHGYRRNQYPQVHRLSGGRQRRRVGWMTFRLPAVMGHRAQ